MPAVGRLSGTPASISDSEVPQTVAIEDEPFELGDLGDDADRVGKFRVRRQHRMNSAPGELAVADFTPSRSAEPAGFADREGREVVVQQESLLVGSLQRVDELLVFTCAERRHHQRLRFTAGEQRRAVGARQHADFADDRAYGLHVAAVDARAGVENIPAHDLGFELFEYAGDLELRIFRVLDIGRREMTHDAVFRGVDCLVALHLVGDRIRGAQLLLDQIEHFLFERRIVGQSQFARLLRRLLRQPDDGVDHRLEMPVAEHHGAKHDVLGELLGLQFHHQHRILGAGDDEIELTLGHLVDLRIEHILVVDEADAGGADRSHERRARQRQRRGRRNHPQNIGIVLEVVRQHVHDDLRVAAPAVGEQRTDRTVDQPGNQRFLFGRPRLALEVTAGNAAGGIVFFLVVAGQRQEVDAFLRRFRRDDGREHGGVAVRGEHRSVGLARKSAGL